MDVVPMPSRDDFEDEFCLRCPRCGDMYTHHGDVRVYWRDREDGTTRVTKIECGHVIAEICPPPNPSARRDAVGIMFTCEGCQGCDDSPFPSEEYELVIAQHKGETFLKWRKWEDRKLAQGAEMGQP